MYHLLKEAIVTHIQYGRRTPLILAYTDEISYFSNRKNVVAPVVLSTLQEKVQQMVAQCNKCKTNSKRIQSMVVDASSWNYDTIESAIHAFIC